MKQMMTLLLAAVMLIALAGCGTETPQVVLPTEPGEETKETTGDLGELVILFTGGLEGSYARDAVQGFVGYGSLEALVDRLAEEKQNVIVVDGGHSVAGNGLEGLWDLIGLCSYDYRVPGQLELSGGVKAFLDQAEDLKHGTYLSCNLVDSAGESVFDAYAIAEVGPVRIGFVGVTRPQKLTEGYRILGSDSQELYDRVQQAVDEATDAGADYVIVISNLGTNPADSPLTAAEVIANITDLDAWLDCGSGAVLDGDLVTDKDDFEIPVCAPGAGFRFVGQVTLNLNDGTVAVELLSDLEGEDKAIAQKAEDLKAE